MNIRTINNIRCYSGDIAPESGVVFVFGSNPEGRHGAGAAKIARERFGAVYGRGEGLQGNAYALPTKDLRVTENRGFRSISPETITESIKKLYGTARQHPDKSFCIAYRNTDRASLNGYTGIEMMRMFNAAGPMPANVIVSEEWARTGLLKKNAESEFLTEGNDSILKQYDAYRVIAPGVNLAVDTKMDNVRDWYELVNDHGGRLIRAANFVTGDLRSYDSAHFENATIGPDGSITLDAVAHNISPEGDVETSETKHPVTFTREELTEMAEKETPDEDLLIRNGDGAPKILWHGSPHQFDEFDFSRAGENTGIVEYTDRRTGEKVLSDSDKAIFFTDNRELAISYGFLARTRELRHLTGLMTDLISCLRDPLHPIVDHIKSKKDLVEAAQALRREDDAELNAFLDRLPDLTGESPISSMAESTREELRNSIISIRGRYQGYWNLNRNGGNSNQLNNIVRQRDYLAYFVKNFDRLCEGDNTVLTEFGKDFNHYMQQFFSADGNYGIGFFMDGDGEIKVSGFDEKSVSLKTVNPEMRKDILQRIEDDLNGCIEKYNTNIAASGYKKHTHLYPVHLKAKNPLVHDYQGSSFPDKYEPNDKYDTAYIAARQVKKALADGNDAVVYKNIRDPFLGNSYGVFSKDNIVMLDRGILPKEQLDCTLGKVTGTVQRYTEVKNGMSTEAKEDIYVRMRKDAEQTIKNHPNADPKAVEDLFTTIDKNEDEDKLRTLSNEALEKANKALADGNRVKFDKLYAEFESYRKEADVVEKMSLEEYRIWAKDHPDNEPSRISPELMDERDFVGIPQGNEEKTVRQESTVRYPTPITRADGRMNYRAANGNTLLHNWVEKAEPFKDGKANVVFGGIRMTINTEGKVLDKEQKNIQEQSTGIKR